MKRKNFLKTVSSSSLGLAAFGANILQNNDTYSVEKDIKKIDGYEHIDISTFDISIVRNDFPITWSGTAFFNNSASHPLSVQSASALHRYTQWSVNEVGNIYGSTGWPEWADERQASKNLFASLINADPSEIAFARATVEAESNVLNGMNILASGGNVVTNDLHYQGSIYNYKVREMEGLDVRIVKNQNWMVRAEDFEKVVDHNTRLIAISLVSNVNGYYTDDVKAISELAHAHGAYLYADIIQAAGAIPIDVKAMGIDIAACSTYKFLMGEKGFGFLYVRKDLQGTVVKPTQHASGVRFNYQPWTNDPDPDRENDILFQPQTGPGQYEVSYPSLEGVICSVESLRYIHRLGVNAIRTHVRGLTDRLRNELPRLGYTSITPEGNESQIVVFASPDPAGTVEKLRRADVHVAMRWGNKMRISPSVFNNDDDVDRLIEALS